MYKILICDVNIKKKGHYIGYNQYILDNVHLIEKKHPAIQITFLFNQEAKHLLNFNKDSFQRASFLDLPDENTFKNRYQTFKKVREITRRDRIDHLIFMDIDQYQLCIFLAKLTCSMSGILFRPHHRIAPSNNRLIARTLNNIRRLKKKIAEKMVISNSGVDSIFILNDQEGVARLNRLHRSNHFRYLPDPVFDYSHAKKTMPAVENNTYRYLLFGALNERKNITNIIRSYAQATLLLKSELLLVGTADEDYIKSLQAIIDSLPSIDRQHKTIVIKADFVSNEDMDRYFSSCHVCLVIYKDFFGSSGLLGRSALHRKKVIGANVGLIAELIDTYKIGLTCAPDSIEDIARSLRMIQEVQVDPASFEDFYKCYSPEKFLFTLIEPTTHEGIDVT